MIGQEICDIYEGGGQGGRWIWWITRGSQIRKPAHTL